MSTLIAFIVVLSIVVLVHEWGHFFAARRSGVAVEEFGFGFPPRLISIRRGATVYSINWIPFGGFVRLKGEGEADAKDSDAYPRQPAWKRFAILASGVGMNYVLAAVLLSIGLTLGVPMAIDGIAPGATVRDQQVRIVATEEQSPAAAAGLESGDAIVSADGRPLSTARDLQTYLKDKSGKPVTLEVMRKQERRNVQVSPTVLDDTGEPRIGVRLAETATVSYPIHRAIWLGVRSTIFLSWEIVTSLFRLLRDLVISHNVSADVVGPIGIAVLTGEVAKLGFASLLQFTALLSLSLAVMNFTPFPALDGGRALFILIEKLRGKALHPRTENLIHNVGFYFLLLMILVISIRDVGTFGLLDALRRLVS